MLFKNATILNDSFEFVKSDIEIKDDKITAIGNILSDENVYDCSGKYIVPGLCDIHTHGGAGHDFKRKLSKEQLEKMLCYYASNGVTTILATFSTDSVEGMEVGVKTIAELDDAGLYGANIGGIHLEGPYFSMEYKGAQNPAYIRKADIDEFNKLMKLSGNRVRIVSIAPETEGALDFIKEVSKTVRVSIAHTNADEETARKAIQLGATNLTHSFNGMKGLHHRNPNAVGAALDSDGVLCEFIGDGMHINKTIIRLMYKLLGDERMLLISDSLQAAGLPDGEYIVDERKTIVKDGLGRLEDGTINGGTSNVFKCVQNAISYGIPAESAFKMGSLTAARAAGIDDVCGSITVGKRADLLILDSEYKLEKVIIKGNFFE